MGQRELPLRSRKRKGGRGWEEGFAASLALPRLRLSPRIDFSPCPVNRYGYCLSHSRSHRQPHYCLHHHRLSRPEKPPPPSCLPLRFPPPPKLVRSRLAETDGVTYCAESIGIRSWSWLMRGCQRKWPRGLPGLVVIRSSSLRLPSSRPAAASRLLRGGGGSSRRHGGAAPRFPRGPEARIPPDQDVAPANISEAEATPEAGAAGNLVCERG